MRSRKRTLLITAGVAAGALTVGLLAGARLMSPADAAARARPPRASMITVPVEYQTLESRIVIRGDTSYEGAVELTVELTGLEAPPVVTGRVPQVGDEVVEGKPVLEIAGRPVILLAGELPMYRTLRPGMSGPDVRQLKETLARLGLDPGAVDETYTAATGRAVGELYKVLGYEPPAAQSEARAALDSAEQQLKAAEDEVRAAKQALAAASAGPSKSQRLAAEQAVEAAERALNDARASGDVHAVAEATAQLELAKAERDEVVAAPDATAERSALAVARERLTEARGAVAEARAAAGTPLPASEVVFVEGLPRRVDEVKVQRGQHVDGAVMSISGADIVVQAIVDDATRGLLSEEMAAQIDLSTGEQIEATITKIERVTAEDAAGGYQIVVTPGDLTAEQEEALRSANVRVTIPVSSTDGDVLAVPLAALSAGPAGESRVEVQRGEATTLVEVNVGLVADGFAEVTPVSGDLAEGDLVVVGE